MPRHDLTTDERRKGQAKGAETKRARLREQRAAADEQLVDAVDRALSRLVALLESEDDHVALRAASQVLDRVLGRPQQPHEHSGAINFEIALKDAHASLTERLLKPRYERAHANGHS
jgi:hypothetical protein